MSLIIPSHLRERQVKASDPRSSIWVSANAGSGKTHVLTQRVIRLLLGGVAPSRILCLTFTKAAAAQMATRVFRTLSDWTALDDPALRAAILETGAAAPTPGDMLLARRLFTRTVETPGGLKIQTIHAFCERLLHLFPFEANVPARFEVADEKRTQEMLSLARHAVIAEAQSQAGPLDAALALVADLAGGTGIEPLIAAAMRLRTAAAHAGADPQSGLAEALGAGSLRDVEAVRRAMIEDGLGPARWLEIAHVFEQSTANDVKQAGRLRTAAALAARGAPARGEAVKAYLTVFFDTADKPRSALMTKTLAKAQAAIEQTLADEQARIVGLRASLKIAEAIERTEALIAIVDAVMKRYERAKGAAGLLDFDDLIARTRTLLDRSDAGWVLHKLDAGIDHVLVDEAQDTSETQWRILEQLTADFATGHGGRSPTRSFFVVGDDKQSIFSFQGAAPLMFDAMRTQFERRFKAGAKPFERVSLSTSFRSVPGILAGVDRIFEDSARQDGLVQPHDIWPLHESIKGSLPGLIEIWPKLGATAAPDPQDWSIPLDVAGENDPASVVADRVARTIKALISADSRERVHDGRGTRQRPIRPGDILVLVRTRNAFFEAVIRAMKRHYVPVAGADRLDVANHIAVMDLVAAGRAALLPSDDLSLACLLKSPLFGFTDDDLIALAPGREGSLFAALAASPVDRHRRAHDAVRRWSARASGATPFAFYVELLGRDEGRKLMEARLGPEAHDAIDEFLRLSLAHEQQQAPSLATFLGEIEALESSIKRDMEGPGDAVRVMTVHAAKGLEAKIVFLPDTCAVPSPRFDPTIFDLNKDSGRAPVLVWSPRKTDDPAIVEAARAAERLATMREYRRLLYVALTRAEERLYIAGFYNQKAPPSDCWNTMIEATFTDAEDVPALWDPEATVKRIVTPGTLDDEALPRPPREQGLLPLAPDWLFQPFAAVRPAAPLRPSSAGVAQGVPSGERRAGLAYGAALHLLLQHLPPLAPAARADAARTYLSARPDLLPAARHDRLIAEALAVIDLPALAPLFAPDARAELPMLAHLARADGTRLEVSGTIDRLAVTADRVLLADFKTGTPQAEVPLAYREQLALYSAVLAPLWPDRPLRALLVWTAGPAVVELDPAALEGLVAARLALP